MKSIMIRIQQVAHLQKREMHLVPIRQQTHGCVGWHGSSNSYIWLDAFYPYFIRGDKILYTFRGREGGYSYLGRAVVVCGEGF